MANVTLNTKIILRNDTSTNWETQNPVLSAGEVGYDKSKGRIKIGNGTSTWTQLDWYSSVESGTGAPASSFLRPVGTTYVDTTNTRMYVCTANTGTACTWTAIANVDDLSTLGYGDMLKSDFATTDAANGFVDKAIEVKDSTSGRTKNLQVNDSATGADTGTNNALWTANKIKSGLDGKSASSHTHESLKKGSYTASLPTLSANSTIALTKDIPTAYLTGASVSGKILTVTDAQGKSYSSGDTVYTHPTTDGNKHVPATSTTHNGHVLVAGSSAGSFSWKSLADAGIAPTANPTFTGNVTVPTPTEDTDAANKAYVDNIIHASDAMVFKGTLGTGGTVTVLPTTDYHAGWTYKVITAGTYAGKKCEIGDMVIAVKTYASATASNDDWNVIQYNIDGAVTSSSTSVTSGHVAIFDGTSGRIIKTGGKALPSGNLVGTTSYATSGTGGVIKSSTADNQIAVNSSGIASVNNITVDKLKIADGDILIINGGTASSFAS